MSKVRLESCASHPRGPPHLAIISVV